MNDRQSIVSRRKVVAGAGVAGAAALAASVLPVRDDGAPGNPEPTTIAKPQEGSYQETEHVLHYYRTARV